MSEHSSTTRSLFANYGFIILLGLQLLYLASIPVIYEYRDGVVSSIDHILSVSIFWLVLIAATGVTESGSFSAYVLKAMVATSVVAELGCLLIRSTTLENAAIIGWIASMTLATYITLRQLVRSIRIDFNLVCASLTVYVSLGIIWSELYSFIEVLQPGSFSTPLGVSSNKLAQGSYEESVATIYYSFVTLTTLGFGDIAPVAPLARLTTAIQALVGQMYLVVMVARIVGLHLVSLNSGGGDNGQ